MTTEVLILELVAAFIFGFTLDFADLLDEHGLKWFKGAVFLSGVVWGIAGAAMMFVYPPVTLFVFGLILYWLAVKKIDYPNHQIAAVVILLTVLWYARFGYLDWFAIIIYTGSYLAVALVHYFLKKRAGQYKFAVARHYIPTILLSIVTGNPWFVVINLACTAGVYLSDWWFKKFEKSAHPDAPNKLGLYIASGTQ